MKHTPIKPLLLLPLAGLLSITALQAQNYEFLSWTVSDPIVGPAYATSSGGMNIGINAVGDVKFFSPSNLKVESNGDIEGTIPGLDVGIYGGTPWNINIDFDKNSEGVLVGMGGFGYGNGFSGYRIAALDGNGQDMGFSGFTYFNQSVNFTEGPGFNILNDDDVTFDGAGYFSVTNVPGNLETDSDMFFMILPSGVSQLRLDPTDGVQDANDRIQFTVAVPIPEPSGVLLIGLSGSLALLRRRRSAAGA